MVGFFGVVKPVALHSEICLEFLFSLHTFESEIRYKCKTFSFTSALTLLFLVCLILACFRVLVLFKSIFKLVNNSVAGSAIVRTSGRSLGARPKVSSHSDQKQVSEKRATAEQAYS